MANYEDWRQKEQIRTGMSIPTISAYVRRQRESKLKDAGFLPWERQWLVSRKLDTPAMRKMIRERRRIYRAARESNATYNDFRKRIGEWYRQQGWQFKDGRLNPFKMLEWYRKRHDLPDTPQPKTRRVKKDYHKIKENTERSKRG